MSNKKRFKCSDKGLEIQQTDTDMTSTTSQKESMSMDDFSFRGRRGRKSLQSRLAILYSHSGI